MLKKMVLFGMALSFVSTMYAAKITEDFENKETLKKWEIEGDAAISADQFHGGKTALAVPAGATATFRFSKENAFGTVTMWVYDSFVARGGKPGKNWNGPYFGLINSDDDKAVELIAWRAYSSVNSYNDVFTGENQWFNIWHSGIDRKKGWSKFVFSFTDDKTLGVTANDAKEDVVFPTKLEFFNKGANGIVFGGGEVLKPVNETVFIDDMEIDVKEAVKEEKPKAK